MRKRTPIHISRLMVIIVALAILTIAMLTVTAIVIGPPDI
jgi:hypothetical protein